MLLSYLILSSPALCYIVLCDMVLFYHDILYYVAFQHIISNYLLKHFITLSCLILSYPTWYYGVLSDISCEIMSCVMLSSLIGYMHTQTHLKTLFLGHEVSGTTISWSAGSQVEGHRVWCFCGLQLCDVWFGDWVFRKLPVLAKTQKAWTMLTLNPEPKAPKPLNYYMRLNTYQYCFGGS